MFIGMVHSSVVKVVGISSVMDDAMMMGRREVSVASCARHASRRRALVSREKVREWKWLTSGIVTFPPVQSEVGVCLVVVGLVEGWLVMFLAASGSGRRSSRFGSRKSVDGLIILLLMLVVQDEERAERRCLWNIIPDPPSPREWW